MKYRFVNEDLEDVFIPRALQPGRHVVQVVQRTETEVVLRYEGPLATPTHTDLNSLLTLGRMIRGEK